MSTFLIILAVVLWVGARFFRKVKAEFADLEVTDAASEQPTHVASPVRQARPAVESLFESESSSTQGSPYFTYESAVVNTSGSPVSALKQEAPVRVEAAAAFDLRQAVIYQTILNNNYISEYQHQ